METSGWVFSYYRGMLFARVFPAVCANTSDTSKRNSTSTSGSKQPVRWQDWRITASFRSAATPS